METTTIMRGLLGKKIGMTRIFDAAGSPKVATVIEAGPCTVVQVKTKKTDGYDAVQLGFLERKEKRTPKPMLGHFKKAGTTPHRVLKEFRDLQTEAKAGEQVKVDIFKVGERVAVTGLSKGHGFMGVVKRHHFSGGPKSHGQSDRLRAPGSIGSSSYPKRVFKGLRMGGRTGGKRNTILNLEIIKIVPERNLLLVKGGVPGARNSILEIRNQ
jgi:large subunit ribosomal protein L3